MGRTSGSRNLAYNWQVTISRDTTLTPSVMRFTSIRELVDTIHCLAGVQIHPQKARRLALGQQTSKFTPKGFKIEKLEPALSGVEQIILPRSIEA